MEPLLKQVNELPRKLGAISVGSKILLGVLAIAVAGGAALLTLISSGGEYQYAYTNLSTEDSTEMAARLKTAAIPHRFEAGGTALSVPASRVYDVRLLLATEGLPRSSGTGFELFDKGDFGVSEFTQKVNLRRATEGELARTIGRLAGVRSARVHLVLSEKGVFRGEDRPASAAVMVNLQSGHRLAERELAGVRHLVASAVPGLSAQQVTIVDGRGAVLSAEEDWRADVQGYQRKLERDLEQRVITLLETVVGSGQVVARVTADVDAAEVQSTQDAFDPEGSVLKSERTVAQNQNQDSAKPSGVVGAAANQPAAAPGGPPSAVNRSASTSSEETRNFEVSRTTTTTVMRAPRLKRLSVAVLLDGVDGKPRAEEEVRRLGELVRRTLGFDEARGDLLEMSSAVFSHSAEEPAPPAAAAVTEAQIPKWAYGAGGGAILALFAIVFLLFRRRGSSGKPVELVLRPGASVGELEQNQLNEQLQAQALPGPDGMATAAETPALADASADYRERARVLARSDPSRAANLLRAWVALETKAG